MNRRSFLRGAFAVGAVALAAPFFPRPRIWGDGIHDDSAGIQWAVNALRDGETIELAPGRYRITKTIYV